MAFDFKTWIKFKLERNNMNEIATNDFDYSLLDEKTKEFLEERANIIYGTDMGVLKSGLEA